MAKTNVPKNKANQPAAKAIATKPTSANPIKADYSSCFHAGLEYTPGSVIKMDGENGPKLMACRSTGVWEEKR
jgi:hypothetical protein